MTEPRQHGDTVMSQDKDYDDDEMITFLDDEEMDDDTAPAFGGLEFPVLQEDEMLLESPLRDSTQNLRIDRVVSFHYSPIFRPLNIEDLASCVAMENAAFEDPRLRASRDQIQYRLTKCPELSMAIFCTAPAEGSLPGFHLETISVARPVETGRLSHDVSVMLAYVIATRSVNDVVNDNDLKHPENWMSNRVPSSIGHREEGETICIHSHAVVPKLQGLGLGSQIMKAFLQEFNKDKGKAYSVKRIVLVCKQSLIPYYEQFGFENVGKSTIEHAGEEFHNMVYKTGVLTTPNITGYSSLSFSRSPSLSPSPPPHSYLSPPRD